MNVLIHMTEKQFTLHWCHSLLAHNGLATASGSALVRYGTSLQDSLMSLDDAVSDSGEIVLDLQHEQQLRMRGVRADQAFTAAVEAEDMQAVRDVGETLWGVLEEAYLASPQDEDGANTLAPDGSESSKP